MNFADSVLESIKGTLPGAHFVESFPLLEKLPFALKPWAKAGSAAFQRDMEWCRERKEVSPVPTEHVRAEADYTNTEMSSGDR